jgi:hypothetical protein
MSLAFCVSSEALQQRRDRFVTNEHCHARDRQRRRYTKRNQTLASCLRSSARPFLRQSQHFYASPLHY